MTTEKYIQDNKTASFKKGDKVVMHTCAEADYYKDKVWTCKTDSYKSRSNTECVFLEGFSGSFFAKYLRTVKTESNG